MCEGRALDDALRRIVVDVEALQLIQELVAVSEARTEPARRSPFREGALHAIFAQRMCARPFRRLAIGAPLHPCFDRTLTGKRGKNSHRARRIVAGADHVPEAQRIGLIFLVAREAQEVELRSRGDHVGDSRPEDRADDLTENAERIARGILLPNVGVVRRDVADFVAEREGELGLVVHQAHQLPRDVNIAAREREGVLDRRIERREMQRLARVRDSGLASDAPTD